MRCTQFRRAIPDRLCVLAPIVAAMWAGGAVWAQCTYEATVIRYPLECAFGEVQTRVNGLNDEGWIVGTYWCPIWEGSRGFFRTPEGEYVDIGVPESAWSVIPTDINNTGLICGSVRITGVGFRGFVYQIDTQEWTWIEPDDPVEQIQAVAMNDAGQVCGVIDSSFAPSRAFLWNPDGTLVELAVDGTRARAINNGGVVTGQFAFTIDEGGEAFIWDGVTITWFGPIPGGISSGSSGINDLGDVTVTGLPDEIETGAHSESYLWRDGYIQQVPTLVGYAGTTIRDINLRGQVVGRWFEPDLNLETALLWQRGIAVTLDSLVTNPEVGSLESPRAINRNGKILVDGHDSTNTIIGFLVEPLDPSPADADGDCDTDFWDLLRVLQDWGQNISPADFDLNGKVNVSDLLFLLGNWG